MIAKNYITLHFNPPVHSIHTFIYNSLCYQSDDVMADSVTEWLPLLVVNDRMAGRVDQDRTMVLCEPTFLKFKSSILTPVS